MLADPIFLAGTLFLLLWITPIIASHAPSPVVSRFPDFVQYQYVLHIVRIHSFSHVTIDCAPYRIIFVCVFVFVYIWTKGHVIVTHHIGLGQTNCGSGDLLAEVGVWE